MGLLGKGLGKLLGIIVGAAAVVGTAAAVDGAVKTKKAKQLNTQTKQIESNAISTYEKAYERANSQQLELGRNKKIAIDFFPWFSDLIERIQDRPNFRGQYDSTYKLQQLDINEIQCISENLRVALAGAAGAGAGALVGLAAFGASAIVAAPAIAVGGFVICAKGNKLYKEAKKNREKVLELEKQINSIVEYLTDVTDYSKSFSDTFNYKSNWNDFNKKERMITKCCVLLTRLATEMCKVEIVIKGSTERVNVKEIEEIQDKAFNLLPKLSY